MNKTSFKWIILGFALLENIQSTFGNFREIRILPLEVVVSLPVGKKLSILTCKFSSNATQASWIGNNGSVIKDENRLFKESTQLQLSFTNVQLEDAGRYTCQVTLQNRTLEQTKDVDVYIPITIIDTPATQSFEINTDAKLKCVVQGEPDNVLWKKGSEIFNDPNPQERIFINNTSTGVGVGLKTISTLTIRNISKADEAKYMCSAAQESRGLGEYQWINVVVEYPPDTISIAPIPESFVTGSTVELKCSANGKPTPKFSWYRSNSTVPLINADTFVLDNINSSNADTYKCTASNERGNKSASVQVTVFVPPQLEISVQPSNPVKENSRVVITCSGTGIPPIDITMFRNGKHLASAPAVGEKSTRVVESFDRNGTKFVVVTFERALRKNAGLYVCKGRNSVGNDSKSYNLDVLYSPKWNHAYSRSIQGCLNSKAVLKCALNGKPTPEVAWVTRQRKTVEQNQSSDSINSSNISSWEYVPLDMNDQLYEYRDADGAQVLEIKTVSSEFFGSYYCRGNNSLGEKTFKIDLINASLPKSPNNIRIRKNGISTTDATIRFSVPKRDMGAELTEFRLKIKNELNTDPPQTLIKNSELSKMEQRYKITNLNPSTEYSIQVFAVNCKGLSLPSVKKYFNTTDIQIPDPVTMKRNESSDSPTSYTLQWMYGSNGGGSWRNLSIVYKQTGSNKTTENKIEEKSVLLSLNDNENLTTSYQLTDLSASTSYVVTVEVFNEVGSAKAIFYFKSGNTSESNQPMKKEKAIAGAGLSFFVVIIIIVSIIVLLIVLDVVLCVSKECGLIYCVSSALGGGTARKSATHTAEEGTAAFKNEGSESESKSKANSSEKQPLAEDAEPMANGTEQASTEANEATPLQTDNSETMVVEEKEEAKPELKSAPEESNEENEKLNP